MYTNEERGSFLNKILLKTCAAKEASKNTELENKKKLNALVRKCIDDLRDEITKTAESGKDICTFYPLAKYHGSSNLITSDFYARVYEYFVNEGFEVSGHYGGITVSWSISK